MNPVSNFADFLKIGLLFLCVPVGTLILTWIFEFLKDVFFPRYDKIKIEEWVSGFYIFTDNNWKRYYWKKWNGEITWSWDLGNATRFNTLEDAQKAACEWLASKPSKKYPIYHSVTCEETKEAKETTQTNT